MQSKVIRSEQHHVRRARARAELVRKLGLIYGMPIELEHQAMVLVREAIAAYLKDPQPLIWGTMKLKLHSS